MTTALLKGQQHHILSFFPDDSPYARAAAAFVDLDELARGLDLREGPSRLLKAALMDRALRCWHRKAGVAYSFGGYLEDRRVLWRGSYLNDDTALHLGIDVNVPAGSVISVAAPARLIHHEQDIDQAGGWGGVSFFELLAPIGDITHFLYAHLRCGGPLLPLGSQVMPGQAVAVLGTKDDNGGWYEHLHVQALTAQAWAQTGGNLALFDGYAPIRYREEGSHPLFPDPWPLLGASDYGFF